MAFITEAGGMIKEAARKILLNPKIDISLKDVVEGPAAVGVGAVKKAGNISSKMFSLEEDPNRLMGFTLKTTGAGKAMIGSVVAGSAGYNMWQEEQQSWNGTMDNGIQQPTPTYQEYFEPQQPSYKDNASADGSLVFALYRNRLG